MFYDSCFKVHLFSVELTRVLEVVGVSRESLERVCEDDTFLVAIKDMKPYDDVAPYLGVREQRVRAIARSTASEEAKSLDMLRHWKRQRGSDATYLALVKGLLEAEDRTTAEAVAAHMKHIDDKMIITDEHKCSISPEKALDNWSEMSPSEQDEVKVQVLEENHEIQKAYARLLVKLCSSYIERNVLPGMIKLCIEGYIHKLINESSTSDPQNWLYQELSSAETTLDMFSVIGKNTSWFNFLLLEAVVENTGNEEEQSLLEEYLSKKLVPYLKCSVYMIPSKATAPDSVSMYLKVSDDIKFSGSNVRTLQRKLAKLLSIPSLEFKAVSEGCVQLMFSIPKALFECYPIKSSLHRYIKWEETVKGYMITADIVQIL